MTIINILLIILILAAIALCIFLIITLKNLLLKVDELQKEVKQIVERTVPVLDNLNYATSRANRIVSEAENYWDEIDSSIKKLKERVSSLSSLTRFKDGDNPAKDLIKNLRAFSKAISAFWSEFKSR